MADFPTIQAELARKSLDHLLHTLGKLDGSKGQLQRAWIVADTLCDITQGLIPSADWNNIYQARQELGEELKAFAK